jgi:quercetin dioxygenase-like cupin family protein
MKFYPNKIRRYNIKTKHIFLFVVMVLCASCTEKTAEQPNQKDSKIITSQDELSFPIGQATDNPALFNGTVYLSPLVRNDDVFNTPGMALVVFPPGIYNKFHVHGGGQILIATEGIGYHQIEGQPIEIMYPGDVAHCPPGVKHWHGASPDGWFSHIAISTNPSMSSLEIFDFISEEEYKSLPRRK